MHNRGSASKPIPVSREVVFSTENDEEELMKKRKGHLMTRERLGSIRESTLRAWPTPDSPT
jgi:hypothetical protein